VEDPEAQRPPQAGASLELALDSGIQFAAERELEAALAEFGARSGAIVLLDPRSGEVLAMASAPGFDPNEYRRFAPEDRRNRALADAHEPGSTFKIVTGALALEDGLVGLDEIIETGDGTIRIANTIISEHDRKRFGPLTLAGVFEHSSNVGIIRIGLRLGAQRLHEGTRSFGIGQPTGVDLPGENPGIFRPLSRWSALSNAEISMGQEVSLTPLQLARVAAAIANGGLLVRPRLVTRILRPDGRVETLPASRPVRVLSADTARKIRDILIGVVERGTGTKAAIPGFLVAGKTGTAQKAGVGGYQPGRYVPAFVGFAPAENPRIVAAVVLEEPHGRLYYGGDVAAPVFARVVAQTLGILRVAPEEQRLPGTMLAALPTGRVRYPPGVVPVSTHAGGTDALSSPVSAPAPEASGLVPSLLGLSAREALGLLARSGASVRLVGNGFVAAQSPPAGSPLKAGAAHTLYLSEDAGAASRAEEVSAEPSSP
jgi:cell division protein FtsI (penicillin-binding protein 3)